MMGTNWAQNKIKNPNALYNKLLGFVLVTSTGFKPVSQFLVFIRVLLC